jgi:membrane-associated phospholipid phosphatase
MALSGAVLAYGVLRGDRHATETGARMLGSLVLATLIKTGLKHVVARTRPNVLLEEGRYEVRPLGPADGSWHSFPSGHTAGSVAVARAVGRMYPQARTIAYGAAAAIALVQIPRGAHYLTDVAAGALVGVAAEAAVNGLAAYIEAATGRDEDRS